MAMICAARRRCGRPSRGSASRARRPVAQHEDRLGADVDPVAHAEDALGARVDVLAELDDLDAGVADLVGELEPVAQHPLDPVAQLEERVDAAVRGLLDLLQAAGGDGDRVQVVERSEQEPRRDQERVHGARRL
jgi:hypothetical protein